VVKLPYTILQKSAAPREIIFTARLLETEIIPEKLHYYGITVA
jgi:hypothetical protein